MEDVDPTPNLTALANIDKTEVKFYSYGILTVWILPFALVLFHGAMLAVFPGIYFIVWLGLAIKLSLPSRKEVDPEKSTFLSRLLYLLVEFTFGVRTTKKNPHQFRMGWFLLFGGPALAFFLFWMYASSVLLVPVILILVKRKTIIRFAFKFALLPRSEYFVENLARLDVKDEEEAIVRREKQEDKYQYSKENQFLHFYPPTRRSRFNSYLFLIFTPLVVVVIFVVFLGLIDQYTDVNVLTENEDGTNNPINAQDAAGIALVAGYIGIIPYMLLSMMRRRRLTKLVTTSLAESVVTTLTSTSVNYLPFFNGEYYFEHNSRVIDMSDRYGFFEIFKNGRLLTIFLLPLAIISYIFDLLITRANDDLAPGEKITAEIFLQELNSDILSGELLLFVLFVLPVLISIILPLIWVLKESELKRTGWTDDSNVSDRKEITSVEDVGTTISRVFSLFLGFSTITGLYSITSDLVSEGVTDADGYVILFVMIIIGALIVLPGTMYMTYRYLSLGDHAAGVNYIRYTLSQSDKIGVGTIVKGYDAILTIDPPTSPYVKSQIGLE